jgi:hypothetical protein
MASQPAATTVRRSLIGRFVYGRDGTLHTTRLLSGVVAAVVLISLATFIGLTLAGAGSPAQLAIWVLAAFLLVKVPLLAVLWWILLHREPAQRSAGWSARECAEILEYLEEQAARSVDLPDAPARLAYFAREAWFVADAATEADKPAAVAAAVRIEAMAADARERAGR